MYVGVYYLASPGTAKVAAVSVPKDWDVRTNLRSWAGRTERRDQHASQGARMKMENGGGCHTQWYEKGPEVAVGSFGRGDRWTMCVRLGSM